MTTYLTVIHETRKQIYQDLSLAKMSPLQCKYVVYEYYYKLDPDGVRDNCGKCGICKSALNWIRYLDESFRLRGK